MALWNEYFMELLGTNDENEIKYEIQIHKTKVGGDQENNITKTEIIQAQQNGNWYKYYKPRMFKFMGDEGTELLHEIIQTKKKCSDNNSI